MTAERSCARVENLRTDRSSISSEAMHGTAQNVHEAGNTSVAPQYRASSAISRIRTLDSLACSDTNGNYLKYGQSCRFSLSYFMAADLRYMRSEGKVIKANRGITKAMSKHDAVRMLGGTPWMRYRLMRATRGTRICAEQNRS